MEEKDWQRKDKRQNNRSKWYNFLDDQIEEIKILIYQRFEDKNSRKIYSK